MIEKGIVKGSTIYNASGAEQVVTSQDGDNRFYAIVAMCGHCGPHYFIPILFGVEAKNLESAKTLVKNIPRVRCNLKNLFLFTQEISRSECLLLRSINKSDKYLNPSLHRLNEKTSKAEYEQEENERKILCEDIARSQLNSEEDQPSNPKIFNKNSLSRFQTEKIDLAELKLADKYDEKLILHKYFAPRKIYEDEELSASNLIYPIVTQKNGDQMLKEYYTQYIMDIAIPRNIISAICYYYQVFGPENELGIYLEGENLCYISNDEIKKFHLFPDQYKYTVNAQPTRFWPQEKKDVGINLDEIDYQNAADKPNMIDKFRKRYEKNPMTR